MCFRIWYNRSMESTEISREKLNQMTKEALVDMLLRQQSEMEDIKEKVDTLNDQLRLMRAMLFGRSSEKDLRKETDPEVDGIQMKFVFNEAEASYQEETPEPSVEEVVKSYKRKKHTGKREEDLSGIPAKQIDHTIPDEELQTLFPEGYDRLPDEVYRKLELHPATFEVLEHHIAVYVSKKGPKKIVRADHPKELLEHSIVTPSLAAGIMNAKYVNSVPIARVEKEFERRDVRISRQVMSGWMIKLSERYLSLVYDSLKAQLLNQPVIHSDETPVCVSKDGRKAGSKSYMWVYRSAGDDRPSVIYDYCMTRNTDHLRDFLGDYEGIIVSDGYASYHRLAKDWPERIRVAGCWAHARRQFANIIKSASGSDRKKAKYTLAQYAVDQIGQIYHLDNELKDLSPEERKKERDLTIRPIVEGYFTWAETHLEEVPKGSNIGKALSYSLNQKEYLCAFLDHPDVPLDNNPAEQAIRPFCVGKHNWHLIDTTHGAEASAMLYSIAETAKANHLKPYEYFKYLLEEIPKHMDDRDMCFLDDLMPWSDPVVERCGKETTTAEK